jgi:hypothetical protein
MNRNTVKTILAAAVIGCTFHLVASLLIDSTWHEPPASATAAATTAERAPRTTTARPELAPAVAPTVELAELPPPPPIADPDNLPFTIDDAPPPGFAAE